MALDEIRRLIELAGRASAEIAPDLKGMDALAVRHVGTLMGQALASLADLGSSAVESPNTDG